ncbi:unnamed protein product [Lupinus luteus]|uniref:Uncharacterized protein n=1 Tax=Lupinus luteus TaxID=3873 RepID=A0AAV1VSH6_LUPLU
MLARGDVWDVDLSRGSDCLGGGVPNGNNYDGGHGSGRDINGGYQDGSIDAGCGRSIKALVTLRSVDQQCCGLLFIESECREWGPRHSMKLVLPMHDFLTIT